MQVSTFYSGTFDKCEVPGTDSKVLHPQTRKQAFVSHRGTRPPGQVLLWAAFCPDVTVCIASKSAVRSADPSFWAFSLARAHRCFTTVNGNPHALRHVDCSKETRYVLGNSTTSRIFTAAYVPNPACLRALRCVTKPPVFSFTSCKMYETPGN